jgi:hypothetical protein
MGGAELVYEYIDYYYQGDWGDSSNQQSNLTQASVPASATVGFQFGGQAFSLSVVDKTADSEDPFCAGDANLWQLTNQDDVSLLLNISRLCNFGKISLLGENPKTLGTLEQRDNIWMIQFIDGTFETLF